MPHGRPPARPPAPGRLSAAWRWSVLTALLCLGLGAWAGLQRRQQAPPASAPPPIEAARPPAPAEPVPAVRAAATPPAADSLPPLFVYLAEVDSTIVQEMRYHGAHNFLGRPVEGYEAPACILTRPAAEALARVQADLRPFGFSLKVYDCYRPQRAVNDFVRWARDLEDLAMKAEFYPDVPKARLFADGYIASRSGHSRGSTVDLTLVPLPAPPQPAYRPGEELVPCTAEVGRRFPDNSLDMGTGYDCFSPLSATAGTAVGPQARANRLLLRTVMVRHGFGNYPQEWWHYSLRGEPYPETYFDFPIRARSAP